MPMAEIERPDAALVSAGVDRGCLSLWRRARNCGNGEREKSSQAKPVARASVDISRRHWGNAEASDCYAFLAKVYVSGVIEL